MESGYAESDKLPLERELQVINKHRSKQDVILIDDLRIFEHNDFEEGNFPFPLFDSTGVYRELRGFQLQKIYGSTGVLIAKPTLGPDTILL
jgi:hypothetical protein